LGLDKVGLIQSICLAEDKATLRSDLSAAGRLYGRAARASAECKDCRTIKLIVDRTADNFAEVRRRIPIEAEAADVDGIIIHFLLHVVHGYMDELELYREDGKSIREMPKAASLRLISLDDDAS